MIIRIWTTKKPIIHLQSSSSYYYYHHYSIITLFFNVEIFFDKFFFSLDLLMWVVTLMWGEGVERLYDLILFCFQKFFSIAFISSIFLPWKRKNLDMNSQKKVTKIEIPNRTFGYAKYKTRKQHTLSRHYFYHYYHHV